MNQPAVKEAAVEYLGEIGELPEGWLETPLDQLLESLESGSRPRGGVRGIKEGIPSIGGEHLSNDGKFRFENVKYVPYEFFKKMKHGHVSLNDILIVKDGATTGKVSLVRSDFPYKQAVVNEHVFLCRLTDNIYQPFIFYFLFSEIGQKRILSNFRGSAQGGINQSFASGTFIPLAPFAEQKRIVVKLETLLARVNAARKRLTRVPDILKRFRQSVLAAACSGQLTPDWREGQIASSESFDIEGTLRRAVSKSDKNKRSNSRIWQEPSFEKRPQSILPNNWSYIALGNLGSWGSGGTPTKSKTQYWQDGTVPWVSPKDMKSDVINDSKDHITEQALSETTLRLLPRDSILFVVRGLILAHSFPVGITNNAVTINQDIRYLITHEGIEPKYLLWALKAETPLILHAVRESTHGTRRLESDTLKTWPIPIPQLAEQKEIVRRVEALITLASHIEQRAKAAAERVEKTTQSIITRAFRGELVETEAEITRREGRDYESAAELLARIQAEKASQTAIKPRRRRG